MITPICPKCSSATFEGTEVKLKRPRATSFLLIHCNECGTVVGVAEHADIPGMLRKLLGNFGISWS
jgi:uncharacterized Zn finger protein